MKSDFPIKLFRHKKSGGIYQLLHEAWMEATHERVTVYKSTADGAVWVRPSAEFAERFEPCGQITK